ncbi:MAG: hypothetical protein AB7O64_02810 [Methylibium sp.]
MPKYTVKSPLDHDGKRYAIGKSVELTEEEAEPLLGHTVELPPAAEKPAAPTKAPTK